MEPIINSQVPEFKVQAFQNGNFKTVSNEDIKGRQNETAKQLPDKCIKALDLFMDKVIEDGNDNKTLE